MQTHMRSTIKFFRSIALRGSLFKTRNIRCFTSIYIKESYLCPEPDALPGAPPDGLHAGPGGTRAQQVAKPRAALRAAHPEREVAELLGALDDAQGADRDDAGEESLDVFLAH